MAVRKIGINCRSMTGRQGFSGRQYESALERDLLDLLAFDLNVERYSVWDLPHLPLVQSYDKKRWARILAELCI